MRPCVLAALRAAARAGTLNAGRGVSKASRRARRRVRRLGRAPRLVRRLMQVSTARACYRFESCERAHAPRQPGHCRHNTAGGWHGACAWVGMTRTLEPKSFAFGRTIRRKAQWERCAEKTACSRSTLADGNLTFMTQDSRLLDLRWSAFAADHCMEEYRHGHGLLRGCFRQFGDERLAVNERTSGVDLVATALRRRFPPILWADEAFLKWCRLPGQVSIAEEVYKNAKKLGLVDSAWDELRMRPHRAEEAMLAGALGNAARFRRLSGAYKLTDLCETSIISLLPENVFIESFRDRLSIRLPLTIDPTEAFDTFLKITGLQLE